MKKALEILKLKLHPEHKMFGKLLTIQSSMAGQILTATARVRAGDLRGRDDTGLDEILDQIKAEDSVTAEMLLN